MGESGLRSGGSLALGIVVGALGSLVLLFILEWFEIVPFNDPAVSGAVFGAIIAGGIGVAGQLLVMAKNDLQMRDSLKMAERVKLENMLSRILRTISVLAQVRTHIESNDPFDNLILGSAPLLMKPLKVNQLPEEFTGDDLALPLQLSDRKFYNLVNVLDSILSNFRWTHAEYEKRMEAYLQKLEKSGQLNFTEGKFEGSGLISLPEYYKLKDLQEHHIQSVYPGLVISKTLLDIVINYLARRHAVDFSWSTRITRTEWAELFEAVDVGDFADDLVN